MQLPTVFVFGPHIGTFSKQALDQTVKSIGQSPHKKWLCETVTGLSAYWQILVESMPEIEAAIPGLRQLTDFDKWLQQGHSDMTQDLQLPNIIVTPLVVMIQLTQYWQYLELTGDSLHGDFQAELVSRRQEDGTNNFEALGFCTGLLAAAAVASAHDHRELQKYGSVAIRLAMILGALVDARNVWDTDKGKGGAVSLAVAWTRPEQGPEVRRIVDRPTHQAHVAVAFDATRSTIITTKSTAAALAKQLREEAGCIVQEMGMEAHIHSPDPAWEIYSDMLNDLCDSEDGLQFANVATLALPTYNNCSEGRSLQIGVEGLTEMVVKGILIQECDWFGTFSAVVNDKKPFLVTLGLQKCVPPSMMKSVGGHQVYFAEDEERLVSSARAKLYDPPQSRKVSFQGNEERLSAPPATRTKPTAPAQPRLDQQQTPLASAQPPFSSVNDQRDDAIAVVGMSIKTAGADDLAEFADMLKTGESQHQLVTRDRLSHDLLFRQDPETQRKWYGCFVRDSDAFDHKFFKRSPRESAAMDPQGRITLQAAYQAVEQAGYFSSHIQEKHVGVYHGVAGVEYSENAFSNEANAFTATGHLRGFISGRLSHYFGWTGPCMTLDTACSSSMVAIHTACRSLLSGECNAALAGGSSIITNMLWYQDMAAGNFLSPTGQCKPFDDNADGYCRAEGFGFVFLKRMSDAVRDGNTILATVLSTGVHQNQNLTPIFVPNSPSLSSLFRDVLTRAGLAAKDVSMVEAHGTGTAVGDPAEYDSIRSVLGGRASGRDKVLPIGSSKGFVGHTESASGVISVIKAIMMMQQGFIPPQASFTKMNRNIDVRPDDKMEIVTSLRSWDDERKVVFINNYGACGSNAAMVVAEPEPSLTRNSMSRDVDARHQHPFWIRGLDSRAIAASCNKLVAYLSSLSKNDTASLADISFNVHRQSNRGLPRGHIFSCSSIPELQRKLLDRAKGSDLQDTQLSKSERPVILCFGGQVSRHVGLDRQLYDRVAILRHHLDSVDAVATQLGFGSIFPGIFSREAVQDTVKLQIMLFAMQYACSKCWQDCGVQSRVAAVVGHSFGEITALCISGALSLESTVKLVGARAGLVRDLWGTEPGSMMAVQADASLVHELVQKANDAPGSDGSASIACHNGPRSFTLVGTTLTVDAMEQLISDAFSSRMVKSKRLDVTNAFHSSLVDNILEGLQRIGETLEFQEPVIPIERATEKDSYGKIDAAFVAEHMRKPVFFHQAVERLSKKYPQAIFLEAGSNSTITTMAARALLTTDDIDQHHFQELSVTDCDSGLNSLTKATVSLWRSGLPSSFWAHHPLQASEYETLILPPYQFDRSPASRHWTPIKSPLDEIKRNVAEALQGQSQVGLLSSASGQKSTGVFDFVGYQDKTQSCARFRLNTGSERYMELASAHIVADTAPICPATLVFDIVIEAAMNLHPGWKGTDGKGQPVVRDMINSSPICFDPSRDFFLDLTAVNGPAQGEFAAHLFSIQKGSGQPETHVRAELCLPGSTNTSYLNEFSRISRTVSHNRVQELLNSSLDDEGVEILQGRQVYRAFRHVVDYADIYRGVRLIVGRGYECAGQVTLDNKHRRPDTWLDVPLSDCFAQVGGMWANLMSPDLAESSEAGETIFISKGVELLMRSPDHDTVTRAAITSWNVYARHTPQDDRSYMTDVYIFDPTAEELVEVILGVQWGRVAKASMSRMLQMRTKDESVLRVKSVPQVSRAPLIASSSLGNVSGSKSKKAPQLQSKQAVLRPSSEAQLDVTDQVRDLVARILGIEATELEIDAEMTDYGIDSLMGMELGREVETVCKCTLDRTLQLQATTLRQLVACVQHALTGRAPSEQNTLAYNEADVQTSTKQVNEPVSDFPESGREKVRVQRPARREMNQEVCNLVATVLGIDAEEMDMDEDMTTYGIDSLMGMEIGREAERVFGAELDKTKQLAANTLRKFARCVEDAVSATNPGLEDEEEDDSPSSPGSALFDVVDPEAGSTASDDDLDRWTLAGTGSTADTPPLNRASGTSTPKSNTELSFSASDILASFETVKRAADDTLGGSLEEFAKTFLASSSRLCTALVVETLRKLGYPLESSEVGQSLVRIPPGSGNDRLVHYLYEFLEKHARQIDVDRKTGQITRTQVAMPSKTSRVMLQELEKQHRDHVTALRLTYHVGQALADVISGKTDGAQLLSEGTAGGDLMASLYREYPLYCAGYSQIRDVIRNALGKIPINDGGNTLRVLEIGSGSIGLTRFMVDFLSSSKLHVEYTFADASPSTVSHARRQLERRYPHLRCVVYNTKGLAVSHALSGQHLVLAHGSLVPEKLSSVRKMLRPDGFLMSLQRTEAVPFMDMISAATLVGDEHATIFSPEAWERELHTASFGHVDWTDGKATANAYQKVIMALASGDQLTRLPPPVPTAAAKVDDGSRTDNVEKLVAKYSHGWATSALRQLPAEKQQYADQAPKRGATVIVTGATGSLGSHIVQKLAEDPTVAQVICINRDSMGVAPLERQHQAFRDRGINLSPGGRAKLRVLGTDTAKPQLGLPPQEYIQLVREVTHIVHNAWPMSWTRPVAAFAPQLQSMRNLLDLARDSAICPDRHHVRLGFQFVSSIGVAGLMTPEPGSQIRVPEERLPLSDCVPKGYTDGKWICEALLDETLHKFPTFFRPHVTRPGQIAGSSSSGYWNSVEHLPFLIKSAQSLRLWPALSGILQWVPVDLSAGVMADLILNADASHAVYHVDNPVGQPWEEMNETMARALRISEASGLVPFSDWVRRVRSSPLVPETENPSARPGMPEWLDANFERMACGGLILGTDKAKEHSRTMAENIGPVSAELVHRFVAYWEKIGFLQQC